MTRPAARRAWLVLLVLLVLTVCVLALTPRPPPRVSLGWDKLNHLAAFAAMAFAAWLATPAGSWRQRAPALAGLLAFGVLIEVLQMQVPGRSAEWADLLADLLGIVLGSGLATGILHASVPAATGQRPAGP